MGAVTTVLVTGCGAPGFPGTLWSLRRGADAREVHVIGADMRSEQAGRYLADAFVEVPAASDDGFVEAMVDICRREAVDVVLPQVTRELPVLAANADRFAAVGTTVAVSAPASVVRASDTGALVDCCVDLGVPAPATFEAESPDELAAASDRLGYPDRRVVVKPPNSNGSRGMRILDPHRDRKRAFYEEKPTGVFSTVEDLQAVLGDSFPRLLVTEYLPGTEYTVDAFRPMDGRGTTTVVPRRRDEIRAGISFRATVVEDEAIIQHAERLADALDLRGAFGFQFKRGRNGRPKILECNPRVQGTMVTSTLAGANVVWAAVASALGEPVPPLEPTWDRSFYRYWGGIGVTGDEVVGNVGELR